VSAASFHTLTAGVAPWHITQTSDGSNIRFQTTICVNLLPKFDMVEGQSPIRVFLVAPALMRWGLERLLSTAAPQIELSGAGHSLIDAAEEIESQFPDVVVVDGNDCSADDIRAVYERARVKILALSSGGDLQVDGVSQTWVDTRKSPGSFVRAIFDAAGTDRAQQPQLPPTARPEQAVAVPNDAAPLAEALTRKQRKVLEAMTANPSAPGKVIADKLHMSEHTLRNHLTEIYAKLGVTGRTHLQSVISSQFSAGQAMGQTA
jgi:two-component system, NarL family, nitrate/nitrite response regulator NarL